LERSIQESFINLRTESDAEGDFRELDRLASVLELSSKQAALDSKKLVEQSRLGNLIQIKKLTSSLQKHSLLFSEALASISGSLISNLASNVIQPDFLNEIQAAAAAIDLQPPKVSRSGILSHPYKLTVDKSNSQIRYGGKIISSSRPSVIAQFLKEEREACGVDVGGFVELLRTVYMTLTANQRSISVPLSEIYEHLTLLPSARKEYSEYAFIRDIAALDGYTPLTSKDGLLLSLPASTSARLSRGYTAVSKDGDERVYASIRFDLAQS